VGYSLDSNKVSAEAEESPMLEAIIWEQLMKVQETKKA
jgi:hypothetical protein